jgi:hypothetical protein
MPFIVCVALCAVFWLSVVCYFVLYMYFPGHCWTYFSYYLLELQTGFYPVAMVL